jgi:hypothetical protein
MVDETARIGPVAAVEHAALVMAEKRKQIDADDVRRRG